MIRHIPPVLLFSGLAALAAAQGIENLQTVAESSDWRATSTHAQVMEYCRELARLSPLVHMDLAGATPEGRDLPLLIIADPPVSEPGQVGDRLVAFAWVGIHSGEVCGKPATLMLARELASTPGHPLLDRLVIVFLPLLNADGNDRMDPANRSGQAGPVQGMGTRANAAGLNINRDFTKLDTLEARAVVKVLNDWDPAIAMDLHTTNGSFHRYVLTYDGQRHPAVDDPLRRLTRYELLPSVTASIRAETGYETFFYGNFRNGNTEWIIDDALPRFSTHSIGMRHHISLLSEAYSYAPYRDRVMGTLAFVRHAFQYVADRGDEVRRVRDGARRRTIELGDNPAPDNMIHLRRQPKLAERPVTVLGYEGAGRRAGRGRRGGGGRGGRGGQRGGGAARQPPGPPRDYQVFYNDLSEPTLSVPRPWAYLVPARFGSALENLALHGIEMTALESSAEIPVEAYRIDSIERAERSYEGHNLVTLGVTSMREVREAPAGTFLVRTGQPLGTLAAYLLEPEAEDGLATWNFFDDALEVGGLFPVVRVPRPLGPPPAP